MSYQTLEKLFYKDKAGYNNIYDKRFNNPETHHLPIYIRGNRGFIVPTMDIINLINSIHNHNTGIKDISSQLSPTALKYYTRELSYREILLTNDIEGVSSTRRELEVANLELSKEKKRQVRWDGILEKYALIGTHKEIPLKNSEDISNLYKEVIQRDFDEPIDGKYFRKEAVEVVTSTQKVLHTGLYPESEIIQQMDLALDWLNTADLPLLVRLSAFHYLFGYIHPFYDGNGRMSRLISSYLISSELDNLIALNLSNAIRNQLTAYYKLFETTNDERNKGELTPFIIGFLGYIDSSAEMVLSQLIAKEHLLNECEKVLEVPDSDENLNALLEILIENYVFSDTGASVEDLVEDTNMSISWVRYALDNLLELGLIKRYKASRSYLYTANLSFDR